MIILGGKFLLLMTVDYILRLSGLNSFIRHAIITSNY